MSRSTSQPQRPSSRIRSPLSLAIALASSAMTPALLHANQLEEVTVVAEKRSESLQDLSQAVTAMSSSDLETKGIESFVDLSGVAPGVTVAKNEGYKTVISIRGVGNEANQNAIANPSVSYHMDGIYVASPFALQTDFIDVERIEVLRGPQGTLFGQNSTGGAINVISRAPSTEVFTAKVDTTFGSYNLQKLRASVNVPLSESIAMRTSVTSATRDGFSKNVLNGQELDDMDNLSLRTDWLFNLSDSTSLRVFGQAFDEDANGAAIKGIDDPTPDARELAQDTRSKYTLESRIVGGILESDLGAVTVKSLASWQKDDILVVRDNDRHSYAVNPEYTISAFDPETSVVETKTFEINMISNEPLFDKVDWIVGAFYLDTELENHIREELDANGNGVLDGYAESFPAVFDGDAGFISDAFPTRESLSLYGQTTFYASDTTRLITGLRYTEDEVYSEVSNFFVPSPDIIEAETDVVTGRLALEQDLGNDAMVYGSYTRGFKPGGSNLTYGSSDDGSPALVDPTFKDETIDAFELGVKAEMLGGLLRTNLASFYYIYENLQFQATDPDIFQGGVANIPESEIYGTELEVTALLGSAWLLDLKLAAIESEITSDFDALDNVAVSGTFFGDELLRYNSRENVKGKELAKTPGVTADLSLQYSNTFASGTAFTGTLQYTYRGSFSQRIFENPAVDKVPAYNLVNAVAAFDLPNSWGFDLMAMNLFDEDGVNSRMSDVFGVNATGEELIPPRQLMARARYQF
ncbi:TonB-dependent receptor [Microbulbifer bruguierae]|uniref:TonB-dependent receptor n=1 Tax=Microbulbifer bruguierae TaxID=3029061 RepID=A0ABY8N9L9_9GAMM|nr:TonB-dependent receptor [Microbulbifer bruguierae]WGL15185.1 TonB-dependent receptor [Microbulbifer bruguierae]